MKTYTKLINSLDKRSSTIGILGLGYVGLPLAIRFAEFGFSVIGFDVDQKKVESLNSGSSYIEHISNESIKNLLKNDSKFTSDFANISKCDALIICVPTPLSEHREPDLSYVLNTMNSIVPHIRIGQIIVLESTTYPGTTDEKLLPILETTKLAVGEDIFLVYSPEREDPGNEKYSTKSIPKVVGGHTKNCLEIGCKLYSGVIDTVVPVSSTKVAEMTKLLENIHRSVNIGLVNEMKIVADRMEIDIHEVIDAAATKPFGFTPYYPGPGLGGHCIPIDPFYLTWKAKEFGLTTRFIELAGEVNTKMPDWVVSKVSDALNDKSKSLRGSKILVLGISYKKNVDDMRESPSVELMKLLKNKGAEISYSDPHVPKFPKMRKYNFDLSSIEITSNSLRNYDCVLISTNHDKFDYELILKNSKLIIDTRGAYKGNYDNLVKA